MKISTREAYDVLIVDMEGKLDTKTSGEASDEMVRIVKSGKPKILLNLEDLEYVSSGGLRIILRSAKLLQSSQGELKICQPNKVVKEVLDISGFHSLLNVYDSEKEALADFLK